MENFKYKIAKFMQGRYGTDQLYKGLNIIIITLIVLNFFVQSIVLSFLFWILFLWTNFRVLSKNRYKRAKENSTYLAIIASLKKRVALPIRRVKEIKTARFRKCSHCKKTMRLKRKPGKHKVICPRCGEKMTVRIII